jgi:hypothetical protein
MRRALVALMTLSMPLTVAVVGAALFESCQTQRTPAAPVDAVVAEAPPPAPRPSSLFADATPRYAGFLVLPDGQQKLAAVLDFAALDRDEGTSVAWRKLRAVLRIMPGGFDGREYSAAYFPAVTYDPATHALDLGTAEGGARIEVQAIDVDALTARVTVHSGSPTATLTMMRLDEGAAWPAPNALAPQAALASPLTGSYAGTCSGRPSDLQLSATKWRGGGIAAFGTLAGFELLATSGHADDSVCRDGGACVKESFTSGQLDLLTGRMILRNGRADATCQVSGNTLTCGPCTWARKAGDEAFAIQGPTTADSAAAAAIAAAALSVDEAPGGSTPTTAADGQYYGYVVHDRTHAMQLLALTLSSQPSATAEGIASLYFGEGDSSELIAYRLMPTAPARPDRPLLLDGDGDAFAVIDEPRGAKLTGTWYSKSFGRVGRFALQRDLVPERPAGATLVGALSGAYQSDAWTFEIAASSGVATDGAEIFPLKLYGWAQENLATSRKRTIQAGVYDHLSGTMALRLDDGRIAFGSLRADGSLDLVWPAKPRAGDALAPDRHQRFQRVKLSGERQARLGIP